MAALRSPRHGDRSLGLGSWVVGLLTTWIAPSMIGLVLIALATALSRGGVAQDTGWLVGLLAAGWVLVFSPLLSWIGLVALVPLFWLLLRAGRAGWASSMAAGALAGLAAMAALTAMGSAMAMLIVVPFGAAAALILRAALGWLAPGALVVAATDRH